MKITDLTRYVRARKARDSEFTDGLESGYTDFKVGALLRQAREKAGLTQEEVAERFQLSSGTCSSSYFSTSTPMISINDASGCVSSSPTMSIKVSSIWTRRSYSCSVWGTNKSGARVGHTCSTVSIGVILIALLLPFPLVIVGVRQDRPNVHLLTIVVNGGD